MKAQLGYFFTGTFKNIVLNIVFWARRCPLCHTGMDGAIRFNVFICKCEHEYDSLNIGYDYIQVRFLSTMTQSFQVEGSHNREISLFNESSIGRFFYGNF